MELDLNKYGVSNTELVINKITYNELVEQDENNTIDGIVIVVKASCEYCSPFIERICEISNNNKNTKEIFALESNELTIEQKIYLNEKYMLTSVPTIMVFENGKFKSIEVGNIDDKTLKKIIIK